MYKEFGPKSSLCPCLTAYEDWTTLHQYGSHHGCNLNGALWKLETSPCNLLPTREALGIQVYEPIWMQSGQFGDSRKPARSWEAYYSLSPLALLQLAPPLSELQFHLNWPIQRLWGGAKPRLQSANWNWRLMPHFNLCFADLVSNLRVPKMCSNFGSAGWAEWRSMGWKQARLAYGSLWRAYCVVWNQQNILKYLKMQGF